MKRKTYRLLLAAFLATAFFNANAQKKPIHEDPKYGGDSVTRVECVKNLSLYGELYDQKDYLQAYPHWRRALEICPDNVSKNLYIHGCTLVKYKYKDSRDPSYVDTLMMVYERRIKNFGQEGFVLGRKGADLLAYRKDDYAQAYEYFKKSVELRDKKSEAAIIVYWMQTAVAMYKTEQITQEEVIETYAKSIEVLDHQIKKTKKDKKEDQLKKALNNVEVLFDESGAATCTALIDLFGPRYEAYPEDIDLLKRATTLLSKYECEDSELFVKTSEQLHSLEPSALSAHNLARMFIKKDDFDKASQYYEQAIDLETDSATLANYYYEYANMAFAKGLNQKVRRLSYKSLNYNPKSGKPYILIGKAYAASADDCGENEFEVNAVYWAAVDKFQTAKNIDTAQDVRTQANKLILTYKEYYPNKENSFFYGVKTGDTYEVKCWINEKTIARFD